MFRAMFALFDTWYATPAPKYGSVSPSPVQMPSAGCTTALSPSLIATSALIPQNAGSLSAPLTPAPKVGLAGTRMKLDAKYQPQASAGVAYARHSAPANN